jgi:hypothetical protein
MMRFGFGGDFIREKPGSGMLWTGGNCSFPLPVPPIIQTGIPVKIYIVKICKILLKTKGVGGGSDHVLLIQP